MGKNTRIAWADHTFNPWIGCHKISAGCLNCYAEREFGRKPKWANAWGHPELTKRIRTSLQYWTQPFKWNQEARLQGKPALVFAGSLCDIFEEDNPYIAAWRIELFEDLIIQTPWLKWLLLTKRPWRAKEFFTNRPELLTGNVWMGTSVENQQAADDRLATLFEIDARVRFVSVEPMLGPVNLQSHGLWPAWVPFSRRRLDWVIIGCESGPARRSMDLNWALSLIGQCQIARCPVYVKQIEVDGKVSQDPARWPAEFRLAMYPEVS